MLIINLCTRNQLLNMRSTCKSLHQLISPLVFSAITLRGMDQGSRHKNLTITLNLIAQHVLTLILFGTKINDAEWHALAHFENVSILYLCDVQFDVATYPVKT